MSYDRIVAGWLGAAEPAADARRARLEDALAKDPNRMFIDEEEGPRVDRLKARILLAELEARVLDWVRDDGEGFVREAFREYRLGWPRPPHVPGCPVCGAIESPGCDRHEVYRGWAIVPSDNPMAAGFDFYPHEEESMRFATTREIARAEIDSEDWGCFSDDPEAD